MLTRRLRAADRVPTAQPVCTGFVSGYRLTFTKVGRDGSGKCSIEPTGNPGDRLFGVVFRIAHAHQAALDTAESLGSGYQRAHIDVVTPNAVWPSTTYVALRTNPTLRPFDWYHALVVAGATQHRLPPGYVAGIQSVTPEVDSDHERRARAESLLSGLR